ncbi:MAG: aspartate kinase [Candidatus Dormiibacterota bacterium]
MSGLGRNVVMKFGGASLGDGERIRRVAEIIEAHAAEVATVVVVSAMEGITDSLLQAAAAASRGESDTWTELGEIIRERYIQACDQVVPSAERPAVRAKLDLELARLKNFCTGFALIQELTPRSLDALSSIGEVMSASLVAATLRDRGMEAEAVDAVELLVTDEAFGQADLLFEPSKDQVQRRLRPLLSRGVVPVVTGYRAATLEGICTTLGRGSSDYTATILGTALQSDQIQIWTHVDGMMTADPRLVADAQVVPALSYREAAELSFFGARVLHLKSLDLPSAAGIPVWIKSSFHPSSQGTRIGGPQPGRPGVRAIASISDAGMFTITGDRAMPHGRLASLVLGWLGADRIQTLVVTQSSAENVISFAVDGREARRVRARLEREWSWSGEGHLISKVEELPDVGVVVAVGEGVRATPGIAARLFGALASVDINVLAIAQGSSEVSISLLVNAADVSSAVAAVHREFALSTAHPAQAHLESHESGEVAPITTRLSETDRGSTATPGQLGLGAGERIS